MPERNADSWNPFPGPWTDKDTLAAAVVCLFVEPVTGLLIAVCLGAYRGFQLVKKAVKTVKSEIGAGYTSVRRAWRNWRWDVRFFFRRIFRKRPRPPKVPTIHDVYRDIVARYRTNLAIIRKSPMQADAKKAAMDREEGELEDRIAQLLG
jgi:hypothetical protein